MKNSIAVLNPVVPFEEYSWVLNSINFWNVHSFVCQYVCDSAVSMYLLCCFRLSTLGIFVFFWGDTP